MSRPTVVISSGSPASTKSCQACMTSAARSKGKNSEPAYSSGVGNSSNSSAVTTP